MSKMGFKELEVWKEAKTLAVKIYEVTNIDVFNKDYGLKDQIRRAAISIPSNIAEGDERDTDKESIRFFYIAKGSLAELITQIEICKEIGYMKDAQINDIINECVILGKKLGALIRARREAIKAGQ